MSLLQILASIVISSFFFIKCINGKPAGGVSVTLDKSKDLRQEIH